MSALATAIFGLVQLVCGNDSANANTYAVAIGLHDAKFHVGFYF